MDLSFQEKSREARKKFYGEDAWPNACQERLLQASLWEGEKARSAWEAWVDQLDFDNIDPGSYRLVPLLYKNVSALGIEHPLLPRLKGIYRNTWCRNQILLFKLKRLLSLFEKEKIPTLLLKGIPLSLLFYEDWGLRPMDDVDLLVPLPKAEEAIHLLQKEGWTAQYEISPRKIILNMHGEVFTDPQKVEADLHWHVLHYGLSKKADRSFWEGAIPILLDSQKTLTLNPTDHFLHLAAHGALGGGATPPIRWLADTTILLRKERFALNWERLINEAKRTHLVGPVKDTLFYLKEHLALPVNEKALQVLSGFPISLKEKALYKAYHPKERSVSEILLLYWYRYVKFSGAQNRFERAFGFLRYLASYWHLKHIWQIPFHLLLKLLRRLLHLIQGKSSTEPY